MGGVPGGILERACKRRLRYFESLRSRSAWGRKVRGSCPKNTESAASLLSARFNEKEDAVYAYNSCEVVLCIKESLDTDYGLTYSRQPSVSRKIAVEISKGASTVMGRLGYAYAVSGRSGEARKILAELQEDSRQRYVSPVAFALVHCGLGEKNEAIRWLERAYEEKAGGIASLKVRPIWSDLRSEPGFVKLLAQMGLTK